MKALVLCGGYGTRLGELTHELPKPMLLIQGTPLLAYTLRYLAHHGFTQIAVNLHFRPDLITSYFGEGSGFGVKLHYSYEENLLGTAGTVKSLASFFADVDDFLVMYGDLLINQNLDVMLQTHREKGAAATLLLHQRAGSNSLVEMNEENRITHFIERPTNNQRLTQYAHWVNSGLQMLNQRILQHIPDKLPADLPHDVYMPLIGREQIYGVPLTGYRCAIDSPERYEEAQKAVQRGLYTVPSS